LTSQVKKVPESAISYVLIGGLVFSLIAEVAGILLYYRQSGGFTFDYSQQWQLAGPNFFAYTLNLLSTLPSLQSATLMAFGIILLMLTSYVRVLGTLVYFVFGRNLMYSLITLFVFLVLTVALLAY
jgi:uncharacterized membrane protein